MSADTAKKSEGGRDERPSSSRHPEAVQVAHVVGGAAKIMQRFFATATEVGCDDADLSVGIIAGKFYPVHTGHQRLVERARRHCDLLIAVVGERDGDQLSGVTRAGWIGQLAPCDEAASLVRRDGHAPEEGAHNPLQWDRASVLRVLAQLRSRNFERSLVPSTTATVRTSHSTHTRLRPAERETLGVAMVTAAAVPASPTPSSPAVPTSPGSGGAGVVVPVWCLDDVPNTSEAWARRALAIASQILGNPGESGASATHMRKKKQMKRLVDFTYGSEPYLYEWARCMGATHIPIKRVFGVHPEARSLREALRENWQYLVLPAQVDACHCFHVIVDDDGDEGLAGPANRRMTTRKPPPSSFTPDGFVDRVAVAVGLPCLRWCVDAPVDSGGHAAEAKLRDDGRVAAAARGCGGTETAATLAPRGACHDALYRLLRQRGAVDRSCGVLIQWQPNQLPILKSVIAADRQHSPFPNRHHVISVVVIAGPSCSSSPSPSPRAGRQLDVAGATLGNNEADANDDDADDAPTTAASMLVSNGDSATTGEQQHRSRPEAVHTSGGGRTGSTQAPEAQRRSPTPSVDFFKAASRRRRRRCSSYVGVVPPTSFLEIQVAAHSCCDVGPNGGRWDGGGGGVGGAGGSNSNHIVQNTTAHGGECRGGLSPDTECPSGGHPATTDRAVANVKAFVTNKLIFPQLFYEYAPGSAQAVGPNAVHHVEEEEEEEEKEEEEEEEGED